MAAESLDVAVLVSEILESLRIPHVLGGSVASTYYSEWRTTNDVDFAVAMRSNHVEAFLARTHQDFLVDAEFVREGVRSQRMFAMIHRGTYMKVDLYVRPASGFFRSQLDRARHAPIRRSPPGSAWIPTHEDVVLQKLCWYKLGGCVSDQQWRDVIGVLKVWHDRMDVSYMSQWAAELEIDDLLKAALADVQSDERA
jgi:hypothetical protein